MKPSEVVDTSFNQEVLQSAVPVLVDFWAAWCQPCRAAGPVIDKLAEEFEGRAKVVKVDCDANMETVNAQGIKGMPTFLVFKNGVKQAEFVGFHSNLEDDLRKALTQNL